MIRRPQRSTLSSSSAASDVYKRQGNKEASGCLIGDYEEKFGQMKYDYPISHGIIQNWDQMESIWNYIFNKINVDTSEHFVLLTEPFQNPINQKQKIGELFFEKYGIPGIYMSTPGILNLYAAGKTTGIVLDSGDGITQSVPVFEGYTLDNAWTRIDFGGREVTHYLQLLLRQSGFYFTSTEDFEQVKKIKEQLCFTKFESKNTKLKENQASLTEKFVLPDGEEIQLTDERSLAPEILFNPSRFGLETMSIAELAVSTIKKIGIDLRKIMYQEIILAGGNTMFDYFPKRLSTEIKKLVPKDLKIKIYTPEDRLIMSWNGGTSLCKLNSFSEQVITKNEYKEYGESILLRK
eukprot:TRINITY_DN14397_c0_g1_i1.p1 TRINITY_DN14397_c0_g1~~TRINITY_DN14397_c0_g1_i1.p1  ORF type:complete len:350 (-),score=69.38 TRINITY_DN14397_c0_g1_i1:314-1363(-)